MGDASSKKPSTIRIVLLLLSGILLVGFGLTMFGWMLFTSTLKPTEGKVLQVNIRHLVGGKKNLYFPEIAYEYSVDGKTYRGDIYSLIPLDDGGTEQWADEIVEQYPVGDTCIVYYRKNKPHHCALTRSPRNRSIGLSVFFIVLGLFVVTLSLMKLSYLRGRV